MLDLVTSVEFDETSRLLLFDFPESGKMLLTGALIFGVPVYMCLIREVKCDTFDEDYPDMGNELFLPDGQVENRLTNSNAQPVDYDDTSPYIGAGRKKPPVQHHHRPRTIRKPVRCRPIVIPRPACSPIIINPEKRSNPAPLLTPITHFVFAFLKAFLTPTECEEY